MAAKACAILGAMLLWALPLGAAGAEAEAFACPDDPRVRVGAGSAALVELVCARIEASRPLLAACGLEQRRPVTLFVVREFEGIPHGPNCMGSYECAKDEIRVLQPDLLPQAVGPDSPWALLPNDELFDSLVTHELAHAFFAQTADDGATRPFVDQEYVAYAMQMAGLDADARARLLAAHPAKETVDRFELNGIVALAAPTLFAAKAWRHFAGAGNGCAFVGQLIRGEVSLALEPR
jgi:hypothetical protein